MNKIWEFFENMNEVVYVADLDTHEIVYANRKIREMYEMQSVKDLEGKKCYEVFQDSHEPCAICNNEKLKKGEFDEWSYFNPILKRTFSVKDTLIEYKGRRLRMEIAFDVTAHEMQKEIVKSYIHNEAVINEALKLALSCSNAVQSVEVLIEYIGKSLECERCYIFELENGLFSNTFEWCNLGTEPQKDNLQNIPEEAARQWMNAFRKNKNIYITNLEETKDEDPVMYELLAPQNIHSLVAIPLYYNGEIVGFFGVDNPPAHAMKNISTALQITTHFIVSLIRRCKLMEKLESLSYYDQLTGLMNRHAMKNYVAELSEDVTLGLVYCDVMGLKRINDEQGHLEGDKLLLRAAKSLREAFSKYVIFRMGGDEFLVICDKISQQELDERVAVLKKSMVENVAVLAVGSVWYEKNPMDFDKVMGEADELMYADKRKYYGIPEQK